MINHFPYGILTFFVAGQREAAEQCAGQYADERADRRQPDRPAAIQAAPTLRQGQGKQTRQGAEGHGSQGEEGNCGGGGGRQQRQRIVEPRRQRFTWQPVPGGQLQPGQPTGKHTRTYGEHPYNRTPFSLLYSLCIYISSVFWSSSDP